MLRLTGASFQMHQLCHRIDFALACLVTAAAAHAQAPAAAQPSETSVVRGTVRANGAPLSGVNVFDLATLAGAITRNDGSFAISTADSATSVRLIARRIGFRPADTTVTRAGDGTFAPVDIDLVPLAVIASITVLAGRFTSNAAERTVTLTPLEVMTTPGGNGDVNSAVKSLPGVQNVDEGSGIFVRGGDFTETRTYIEGAPMFTDYQFDAPTGSVAGTINPFLTSGITFSSGGFGANWGNALSGIVDLQSQNRPQATTASVNATLVGAGAGVTLRLPNGFGLGATAGASDLTMLLRLNGNPRAFAPAPRGTTVSAQGIWEYSATGRVKVFTLRQHSAMGITVDDPAMPSPFTTHRTADIAVASLRDTVGKWRPFLVLSTSGLSRGETKGVLDTRSRLRSWNAHAETAYAWSERIVASVGVEDERIVAAYDTRVPTNAYDPAMGAPSTVNSLDRAGSRDGEFAQLDTRPSARTELILGTRTDRSAFSSARTRDPRASFAWVPLDSLTLTASWGRYHQVADPVFLSQAPPGLTLPSISAEMSIVGAQLGDGSRFVRLEGWRKQYRDLVGLTRDWATVAGLGGHSSGVDLFARSTAPLGARVRFTWSSAWSRRTDPDTRLEAAAPYDVTHSITAVLERDWSSGWHAGISHRFASGRPFTDVVSARLDSTRSIYVPTYGPSNAGRLPDYQRADIAISRATTLGRDGFLVIFGAIQNPFNVVNITSYTWTYDYAERVPVRTAINRSLFIGANLVRSRNP